MEAVIEFNSRNRFKAEILKENEVKATLEGKYDQNVIMRR